MSSETIRRIRVARLHQKRISEYRRLHDNIPEIIVRHLKEAGYTDVQIYLCDDLLVMFTEFDAQKIVPDRVFDELSEQDWQAKTGSCFSLTWQDANQIFDIRDHPLDAISD